MFKKSVKRSVAVLLTLVLLLTSLPLTAFAEATTASAETEDEYIYYSDLFYGYSYYLANAPYLTAYYTDTQGILDQIYDDYMDSPNFKWTNIKNSLAMATNLKEWTKMITDAFGITSFTYEKALDAANVDFATQLTGGSEIAKAYGTELKWVKKINDILKVYDAFDKNYDISVMTETEVFTAMFETIGDSGVLVSINKTTLTTLQKDILPHISTITSRLSKGADIITAAKTIATGIMMEDFRLDLIDEILGSTASGTMLYDGMLRMRNQLKNGFVSYFLDQYLTDKVLNEIADKIVKKITGAVLEDQAGTYALICAITKVASWIVFDLIFDVPDIDDLTKQMVLSEYAYNLHTLLIKKVALFNAQFETEDIYDLETLATAYSAAVNAALDASDKLKLSNNSTELKTVTDKYSKVAFYNEWIESAKSSIKSTDSDERIITDFATWKLTEDTTLRCGSDTIENNSLYCVASGFKGNIVSTHGLVYTQDEYYTVTIPENKTFILCGDMDLESDLIIRGELNINGKLLGEHVYNYGELSVNGKFKSQYGDFNYGKMNVKDFEVSRNFYNYGEINVLGNFTIKSSYGYFYMSNSGAVLRVGGDICFLNEKSSKISGGTVILNGLAQQNIEDFLAPVLIIDNTSEEGVQFKTKVNFSILFDHQGNNFSLNKGGTFVDYDGDGMKDNVDPYPTIHEKCLDGHNYGDWEIVRDATPSIRGIKYRECMGCGDRITETIPTIEKLAFKGASLTLHHNLAINYKVDKALFDTVGYTNPYVVFEIGGKKTTVKAYSVEGDRYVFRFRNIAPNQMNDTIYATLYATYNGVEYASETKEYIVAEYCYSTLNKYSADDYAELRTLLVDLLHYGAQSQLYTKYNVDNLVNANLTEVQLAWGTDDDPTLTNSLNTEYETVENPLITWKGASLNLNDSVSMRFKFIAEDIAGLSLKIASETGEWNITSNNFVLEDGVYTVRFSGLNAGQMSEKVYITMYKDGIAVSNTVCYSIESYAYSKQDSTIEYLSDLVKAMMKYGNSAHSYVN